LDGKGADDKSKLIKIRIEHQVIQYSSLKVSVTIILLLHEIYIVYYCIIYNYIAVFKSTQVPTINYNNNPPCVFLCQLKY